MDPLPILMSGTYRGFYDGAQTVYAWYRGVNLLELVASKSDGTSSTGI